MLCLGAQSCPALCDSRRLYPTRLFCSWGFSRQEYWNGFPSPPPGDLLKPGINSGVLNCRWILYHLSRQGSPLIPLKWSESHLVVSDSLWPCGIYSPRNSLGQNTEVGCHFLLQGSFPTKGSNPDLSHCRQIFFFFLQILYQLSHKGSSLIPLSGIKSVPLAHVPYSRSMAWSPNHWITWESPIFFFFSNIVASTKITRHMRRKDTMRKERNNRQ